jgi:hypothetical protein
MALETPMRNIIRHAVFLGLGMLLVSTNIARSDEAGGSREQIIEGVRDDVHRKIQERNGTPAESQEEAATGTKQPANASAHPNTKQEKSDTAK